MLKPILTRQTGQLKCFESRDLVAIEKCFCLVASEVGNNQVMKFLDSESSSE
jgi:hypothetical protein